jgi:hypothetical protein
MVAAMMINALLRPVALITVLAIWALTGLRPEAWLIEG